MKWTFNFLSSPHDANIMAHYGIFAASIPSSRVRVPVQDSLVSLFQSCDIIHIVAEIVCKSNENTKQTIQQQNLM